MFSGTDDSSIPAEQDQQIGCQHASESGIPPFCERPPVRLRRCLEWSVTGRSEQVFNRLPNPLISLASQSSLLPLAARQTCVSPGSRCPALPGRRCRSRWLRSAPGLSGRGGCGRGTPWRGRFAALCSLLPAASKGACVAPGSRCPRAAGRVSVPALVGSAGRTQERVRSATRKGFLVVADHCLQNWNAGIKNRVHSSRLADPCFSRQSLHVIDPFLLALIGLCRGVTKPAWRKGRRRGLKILRGVTPMWVRFPPPVLDSGKDPRSQLAGRSALPTGFACGSTSASRSATRATTGSGRSLSLSRRISHGFMRNTIDHDHETDFFLDRWGGLRRLEDD